MKPVKPRLAGGPHDALAQLLAEIAEGEGQPAASGVEIAAAFEGRSKWQFYKELDPDQREEMPFTRVARLTSRFRARAAADHLASLCGCVLVALPQQTAGGDAWAEALGNTSMQVGDVLVAIGASIRDRKITPAERAKAKREIREAHQALAVLDAMLDTEGNAE